MNRFLLLILVAGVTFLVVLFIMKPEMIENIWMWLVGLAGAIVKAFQLLVEFIQEKFSNTLQSTKQKEPGVSAQGTNETANPELQESNPGTSMNLFRYSDDGTTTVGLLFVNNQFYCYTLEDTLQEEEKSDNKRIPAGTYPVLFKKTDNELTLKYRDHFPEWFTYHIQIQEAHGKDDVYIHCGGDADFAEECILVSDSLNISNEKSFLSSSRETFRRLYGFLQEQMEKNIATRLTIYDERWINNLK